MAAPTLDALLVKQSGLVTPAQVRSTGLSAYRLRGQLARREWLPMYGGRVLRRPGPPPMAAVLDRAALLALGAGATLAGPSAARLHGIRVDWPRPVVRVRVGSRREPSGIDVVRGAVADEDVGLVDDVLVTERPLAVVDALVLLPEPRGRELLDRALQLRWLTFDELVRRTQLLVGRPGIVRLRRHVRAAAPGARSEAERLLVRLLRRSELRGWVCQHVVEGIGVLDVAFPELRVAVEVDGWAWHSAGDRFQHDRTRQNALVAQGWTVLRFTWADLRERPEHVLAVVTKAVNRLRVAT